MNCNDTMLCSFVNCEEKEIEIILNNDEKVKGKLIHRKSILLLRHGARAPSLQAYKVLLNSDGSFFILICQRITFLFISS